MSLAEETLSSKVNMPFTSSQSAIKTLNKLREELERRANAYVAKGGKIQQVPATTYITEK